MEVGDGGMKGWRRKRKMGKGEERTGLRGGLGVSE